MDEIGGEEIMYIIVNGRYYLSNKYEKAAEQILGYGGVYTPKFEEAKIFETKYDALLELRKAKIANPWVEIKEIH